MRPAASSTLAANDWEPKPNLPEHGTPLSTETLHNGNEDEPHRKKKQAKITAWKGTCIEAATTNNTKKLDLQSKTRKEYVAKIYIEIAICQPDPVKEALEKKGTCTSFNKQKERREFDSAHAPR